MKEKIKNIEFLRFAFAIGICFLHLVRRNFFKNSSDETLHNLYMYVGDANKLVDFFFIIAGYFLFSHMNSNLSVFDFIRKKLIRFWPNMCFAFGCLFILSLFTSVHWDIEVAFSSLFFFNNVIVVPYNHILNVLWFIIALFWASLFYFCLFNYFNTKNIKAFCIGIIIFASYRMLCQDNTNIAEHNNKLFWTTEILRALGGMGIGYFLSLIPIQNINISSKEFVKKLLWSILELCLVCFLFKYMFYTTNHVKNTLFFIIVFCSLFICFLFKKGYISQLCEKNWSVYLGRYAFSIYCVHQLVNQLAEQYIFKNYTFWIETHISLFLTLVVSTSILFGIFTYHFIEVPGAKLMKKLLFPQPEENPQSLEKLGGGGQLWFTQLRTIINAAQVMFDRRVLCRC